MSDAKYYRDLEARLNAEFPMEGARFEINTLRFLLAQRTNERDHARDIAVSLEQELAEIAQPRLPSYHLRPARWGVGDPWSADAFMEATEE